MARKASGADQVASARELLRTAKTADELRTAQAVLLPLERGLSLEMTARVIGRSIGATCNLRTRYKQGGVVVVPPLREQIAERLGKPVALSTIYRMLARNGWRKPAPDTAHPQGNPSAREDWKKTPGESGSDRGELEQRPAAAADVPGRGAFRTHPGHTLLLVPSPSSTARQCHGNAAIYRRLWRRQSSGRLLR